MELFDSIIFRGQGHVFIGDTDANGNPINLQYAGDISAFNITPNISRGNHLESGSGARAEIASWNESVQFSLAITSHSIKPAHLAKILQGVATSITGNTVTDESHPAYHDAFVALDHTNISAVTVTDVGGVQTFVADTDYIVHADEGLIEILSTGAITDGETIEVDYTFATQSHVTTDPGNSTVSIVLAGKNTADSDKQVRIELYKVKLDTGAMGGITTGAAASTINGTIQKDTRRAAGDQFFKYKIAA